MDRFLDGLFLPSWGESLSKVSQLLHLNPCEVGSGREDEPNLRSRISSKFLCFRPTYNQHNDIAYTQATILYDSGIPSLQLVIGGHPIETLENAPLGEATRQLKVRNVGQLKINSSELADFGMVYGKNVKAYVCHKKHVSINIYIYMLVMPYLLVQIIYLCLTKRVIYSMNAIGPKKGSHGSLVQTGVQNQSRIISGQDDDDIFALVLHLFDQSIHSFLAKAVLPETSGHLCNVHVQFAHVQVP